MRRATSPRVVQAQVRALRIAPRLFASSVRDESASKNRQDVCPCKSSSISFRYSQSAPKPSGPCLRLFRLFRVAAAPWHSPSLRCGRRESEGGERESSLARGNRLSALDLRLMKKKCCSVSNARWRSAARRRNLRLLLDLVANSAG